MHTTFCGRSEGLFWFGHVDFHEVAGDRCPTCVEAAVARGEAGRIHAWPTDGA